jgi:hypothetical protein
MCVSKKSLKNQTTVHSLKKCYVCVCVCLSYALFLFTGVSFNLKPPILLILILPLLSKFAQRKINNKKSQCMFRQNSDGFIPVACLLACFRHTVTVTLEFASRDMNLHFISLQPVLPTFSLKR